MITLTREKAQQVLDALEGSIDAQEWEINDHITKYGEWYRPKRVEYMKQQLANTNSTIETLRARLSAPEHEWQGLTDEEIRQLEIMEDEEEERKGWCDPKLLIAWTEAKLKEKNT